MNPEKEIFPLEYNRWLITVEPMNRPATIYKIHFKNEIPDMLIEKVPQPNSTSIWRSVNDNLHEMALGIGKLIDQHLSNK
ncbi:MAG: hypothetical protein V4556_08845 [Bacteroidota bacterium]